MSKPRKEKKPPTLEELMKEELKKLRISYNYIHSKFPFLSAHNKTYGTIAQAFGKNISDPVLKVKPCKTPDVEIFRDQIKQIIEDKYASYRLLPDARGTSEGLGEREELPEPEHTRSSESDSNTQDSAPVRELEIEITEGQDESAKAESSYVAKYPDQKAVLMIANCNQQKAAKEIWDKLTIEDKAAIALIATMGAGKTFIGASIIKNFIEQGWIKKLQSLSPWPIIWITRATIVEQTETVLREKFNINVINTVHVLNVEQLRTKLGRIFVKEQIAHENGEDYYKFQWNPHIHPVFFLWDEFQMFARNAATQTQICQAASEIEKLHNVKVKHLFMSATPFARVSEAKTFCLATGLSFELGLQTVKLTDEVWPQFARMVAHPSDPEEYCTAAVDRLMKVLEPYIVRIKGIRPKHRSYNSTERIRFQTKEEREEYEKAWEHYQQQKSKIEGMEGLSASQERFALLAQFTIFRKAAERIRRFHLAKFAHQSWESGKAPAIACAFKTTITGVVKILINDYNWSRDDISIIWGGSTETLTNKQKIAKKLEQSPEMKKVLEMLGLNLEHLGIEMDEMKRKTDEDYLFEKVNRLLTQKPGDREQERLRYQRQDSRLLIFTYKAGGVGLSAHHEAADEHCRIPLYPNARPREGIFTPVYSEKELIQALGRLPRINSVSDTFQRIVYYSNTIESAVAERVQQKMKCMSHVVAMKEHWQDIVTGKPTMDFEDEDETEYGKMIDAASGDDVDGNLLMSYTPPTEGEE